jgi:hypothetical protein
MNVADTTHPRPAARPSLWFLQTTLPPLTRHRASVLDWILRLATAGAYIGHGAYGAFMQKPGWYGLLDELGYSRASVDANNLHIIFGSFEMALGVLALVLPIPALLLFMVIWKIGSEFLWYPGHGLPAWEWVERWSNYTAPLALIIVRGWPRTFADWFRLHTSTNPLKRASEA